MGYRSFAAPRLVDAVIPISTPRLITNQDAKYVTCQIVAPGVMVRVRIDE